VNIAPICSSKRVRSWLPVFAAMVALAPIAEIIAQQPQSRQPSASILVGGYRIALGMSIEQVNSSLGGVFTASMTDSRSWLYSQNDRQVAKVFLENGRVVEIVKYFAIISNAETVVDRLIRGTKEAVEEFGNLTRGLSCNRVIGDEYSGPAGGPGYQLDFRCGPYVLNHTIWKFRDGEMASTTAIYVTR